MFPVASVVVRGVSGVTSIGASRFGHPKHRDYTLIFTARQRLCGDNARSWAYLSAALVISAAPPHGRQADDPEQHQRAAIARPQNLWLTPPVVMTPDRPVKHVSLRLQWHRFVHFPPQAYGCDGKKGGRSPLTVSVQSKIVSVAGDARGEPRLSRARHSP